MTKSTKFHVKINGGPEQVIETKSGLYNLAVSAALAQLDYESLPDEPDIVEIWVPSLLPEYGPYFYMFNGHSVTPCSKPT